MTGPHPAAEPPSRLETVLAGLRDRVLVVVRGVLLYAAMPGLALMTVVQGSVAQLIELIATFFVGLTLVSPSHRVVVGGPVVVAYLLVLSGIALAVFGPTIGTGLFFLAALLAASFFLETVWAIATFLFLTSLMVALSVGIGSGVLHPTYAPASTDLMRITLSTGITLGAAGAIFHFIQRQMRESIVAAIAAGEQAQAAQFERERALRAMEASQRLEALGRLAGGVAHDINNALFVIQAAAEELAHPTPVPQQASLTEEIRKGVARATATSRQLLAFSRGSVEPSGTCEPRQRLSQLAQSLSRVLPANITLHAAGDSTSTIGLAPGAFEQIVLNLVLNARDAMPAGGTIDLTSEDQDDHVVVSVRDQGTGMSAEQAARAFEPFFTTKAEKGTGLGLAMVWAAVTRAEGTVTLESKPNVGTVVRLSFPKKAAAVATVSRTSGKPPSFAVILLLEDQPDVARAMVRMLARAGHEVDRVATVHDAINHIAAGRYSLFVTDGQVPDGPIWPAVDAFRRRRPGGPVILCSGHAEDPELVEGASVHRLEVVRKPVESDELTALVSTLIARSALDEHAATT